MVRRRNSLLVRGTDTQMCSVAYPYVVTV